MSFRILVINLGSTSTKLSFFEDDTCKAAASVDLDASVAKYPRPIDQLPVRLTAVREFMREHNFSLADINAIACRGGLLHPLESGTYVINDAMVAELEEHPSGIHAVNLGAHIGLVLAKEGGIPAYIVDPVIVDELEPMARLTGLKGIERHSIFHALNQKAIARQTAADLGMKYEDADLIVAHLGTGISVGAHRHGRIVDVNNALQGDGPFAADRTGSLPAVGLVELCFSGKYTKEDVMNIITRQGGLVSHLGTNNARIVEKMIQDGDEHARLVYMAMAYNVAKAIGAAATVFSGHVDAISLTGGMARSQMLVDEITRRVQFIAPVRLYPGEDEMRALALGVLRVLNGTEQAKPYPPECS